MHASLQPGLSQCHKATKWILLCIYLAVFLLVCRAPADAQAPSPATTIVNIDVNNLPLDSVCSLVEKQTFFRFAYNTELVQLQKRITYRSGPVALTELLKILFRDTNLGYSIIGNQIILQRTVTPNKVVINGYVRDTKTGEMLIGAAVYLPAHKTGTISNNYGFYAVTVPQAEAMDLQVSYVGYQTVTKKVNAARSTALNIDLEQHQDSVKHVIVVDDRSNENIRLNQLSTVDISSDMLADAPSVSGTGDIINAVEMQPGVHAGLEGTPGFFVRGGNSGQNLVQLDEANLYNPSHMFELVSIFNPATIKRATLLKGGFPAAYGDYLSSVLDISMNDGDNQQFGGVVQTGTIVSGVTLYGPVKRKKASFLVAARRSMIDLLLQPFAVQNYFSNYAFYDVNAKLSYQFSQRDRIFLSYYKGQDHNTYQGETTDSSAITYANKFGNEVFAFRWNHLFSRKLFVNTSAMYNDYYQSVSAIQDDYFAQLYSGIRDVNIKTDFYYYPGQAHRIKGGVNYLRQQLFPATVSDKIPPSGVINNIKPDEIHEKTTQRIAAYLSDEIRFSNKLSAYLGVRVPVFYTPAVQYIDVEPRVSLRYLVNPTTSIKVAYTQMHQYIHLVQSYNSSFPAEIWIGSSDVVKPQLGHQLSVGLFKNFADNIFQASIEGYYKLMENQLLFKGKTEPTIDENLENNLIFGKGRSFGIEFFIRKKKGKLTGWIAYALAHAYQQFDSLNLGSEFPFAYDRRHSFYLTSAYAINRHWKVAANFFAATGRNFTVSTTKPSGNPLYDDENNNSTPASGPPDIEVNNYSLSPYDRLDLAVSYRNVKQRARKTTETEWSLSVYNVYAQNNIFFAYRAIDPVSKQAIIKEVSFIPVIPTLSFRYKF